MFSSGDYFAMIGMAFALVMTLVIGGFVLLFPVTRRLGTAVEEWIRLRQKEAAREVPAGEVARLARAVEAMHEDLERIAARQEFVESLLEGGEGGSSGTERKRVAATGERGAG